MSECLIEPVWDENSELTVVEPAEVSLSECLIEPVWDENFQNDLRLMVYPV